jgi:lipopolysaccharide exporter
MRRQSEDHGLTAVPSSRRAASALLWTYGLTLLKLAIAFALSLVLAHILGPGPFGLVAVGLLVVGPGMLLVEAGAGAALIQREAIDSDVIASAFTWQVMGGLSLSAVCTLLAPALAWLLRTPSAAPVLRALAPAFLIQSVGLVSAALLRRELRHRDVLLATTITYAISYGVIALPMALTGAGVWALVTAQLLQSALASAAMIALKPHSWRLRAPWADRQLLHFSAQVLRVNGLNWLIENGDNLLVGRLFGPTSLGLYGRAYSTIRLPADGLLTALQAVSFAGHSRVKDLGMARRGFVAAVNAVSLLALPLFATTAVLGPNLIVGLYGRAWAGAGPLVLPLSIAMAFHCLVALSGPVLWARNRVRLEYVAQLASLSVLAAALVVLSGNVVQVAWAVALAYAIRGVLMTSAAARLLEVPPSLTFRACLSGWRAATVAAVASALLRLSGAPALVVVLAGLLVCAAAAAQRSLTRNPREWTDELRLTAGSLGVPAIDKRLGASPGRTVVAAAS